MKKILIAVAAVIALNATAKTASFQEQISQGLDLARPVAQKKAKSAHDNFFARVRMVKLGITNRAQLIGILGEPRKDLSKSRLGETEELGYRSPADENGHTVVVLFTVSLERVVTDLRFDFGS